LTFFGRRKFETVELLGLFQPQTAAKALDAAVGLGKSTRVHQFLLDRHAIAAEPHLRLDPFPVRFAA
jgi:hypothetical protein